MTIDPNNTSIQKAQPAAGIVARQGFDSREIERRAETATVALAARATAEVQARYIMARGNPRDHETVLHRLLAASQRPGFAAAARFRKPAGKKKDANGNWVDAFAEGFTVRFAEEAARCLGNLVSASSVVYDDANAQHIEVSVTDLEVNLTESEIVVVEKTVERSDSKGRIVLSSRPNSAGKTTFLVQATNDELLMKAGSLKAKARRNMILRMLPSDIAAEALAVIENVRQSIDPVLWIDGALESFARLSPPVARPQIEAWLGHSLATITVQECQELQDIDCAIRDGETTWDEVMKAKAMTVDPDPVAAKTDPLDKLGVKPREKSGGTTTQTAEPQPVQPVQPAADRQAQGIDTAAWIAERSMKRASSIAHDLVAELASLSPADATALEDAVVAHLAKQPRVGGTEGALRLIDEARRQTS